MLNRCIRREFTVVSKYDTNADPNAYELPWFGEDRPLNIYGCHFGERRQDINTHGIDNVE